MTAPQLLDFSLSVIAALQPACRFNQHIQMIYHGFLPTVSVLFKLSDHGPF
jgi:hypothetical protein